VTQEFRQEEIVREQRVEMCSGRIS